MTKRRKIGLGLLLLVTIATGTVIGLIGRKLVMDYERSRIRMSTHEFIALLNSPLGPDPFQRDREEVRAWLIQYRQSQSPRRPVERP